MIFFKFLKKFGTNGQNPLQRDPEQFDGFLVCMPCFGDWFYSFAHLNVWLIGCICIKRNKKAPTMYSCSAAPLCSPQNKMPFLGFAWLLRAAGLASSKQLPSLSPTWGQLCLFLLASYLSTLLSLSLSLSKYLTQMDSFHTLGSNYYFFKF
jgi:hypothetical protein